MLEAAGPGDLVLDVGSPANPVLTVAGSGDRKRARGGPTEKSWRANGRGRLANAKRLY